MEPLAILAVLTAWFNSLRVSELNVLDDVFSNKEIKLSWKN